MNRSVINLREKLAKFADRWSPRVIAEMNDYQFKVAKIQGDFVWHCHPETDEAFIVIDGHMAIEFRDGRVELGPGEMYVVPKGIEHKPMAVEECHIMLVELKGTVNTGTAGGAHTAPNDEWV